MQKVNLRNLHIKWNLDSRNKNCILIVTEPTTPLIFMRNPVGLSAECYDKHFVIFILIKNSHLFTYNRTASLCEKRDISKYRLSQLSGISQSSLGRIMAQENLPSLITLEKI